MQKVQIKNMVCPRCVMAVENLLKQNEIDFIEVRLGEVILDSELSKSQKQTLQEQLVKLGFELLDDRNAALINKIKTLIINQIQSESNNNLKLSELISKKMNKDYSQLSKLFSSTLGITIEQFAILQKVEKIKELLIYDELSLKEISFRLNYSSPAHLSSAFKKATGFTPSEFKKLNIKNRKGIEQIWLNFVFLIYLKI